MKTVTEAIESRKSIRSFLSNPVSNDLISDLLEKASFSPSGGNLQPWKIFIINDESMKSFLEFQKSWNEPEVPEYLIYPQKLKEPYRTSRYEMGELMYSSLGIDREDKASRANQMMKNFDFFNAPAGLFCFIDRQMNQPQWSDLGMFLQSFMLLAQEVGLDTCAQESWSLKHKMVSTYLGADEDLMLFCGMAIGYQDPDDPVNRFRTERRPLNDWAKFIKK